MTTRYVILHHGTPDGEHWDLMLEHEGWLLTWQLLKEPRGRAHLPIPAIRIGDHRLAYLEYEGPISGDRGEVRRVDQGTVQISQMQESVCWFRLEGMLFRGWFRMVKHETGWNFESAETDAGGGDARSACGEP